MASVSAPPNEDAFTDCLLSELAPILVEEETITRDLIGSLLEERRKRLFIELEARICKARKSAPKTLDAARVRAKSEPAEARESPKTLDASAVRAKSEPAEIWKAPETINADSKDRQDQEFPTTSASTQESTKKVHAAPGFHTLTMSTAAHEVRSLAKFGTIHHYFGIDPLKVRGFLFKKRLPRRLSTFASSVVLSTRFDAMMSAAILLNAAVIAWEADNTMGDVLGYWRSLSPGHISDFHQVHQSSKFWRIIDTIFGIVFLVEVILRLSAHELAFFFGKSSKWNILDSFLVIVGWTDIIVSTQGSGGNHQSLSAMRLMRILRVARSLRIIRVLNIFREMRVVLLSLLGSIVPLFWTSFCLFVILFVFVTIFMQGAADYVAHSAGGSKVVRVGISENFSSFWTTMLTLLMSITGGADWKEFYTITSDISPLYSILFIVYIIVMTFGALNVITAIFVEGALAKAREDFEILKSEERSKLHSNTKRLEKVFRELDPGMTGHITKEQWEQLSANGVLTSYFHMLEIDIPKADDVFRLLDIDGSQVLDLAEFVNGCLQIKGSASFVDVEMLMNASKSLMAKTSRSFAALEMKMEKDNRIARSMLQQVLDRLDADASIPSDGPTVAYA